MNPFASARLLLSSSHPSSPSTALPLLDHLHDLLFILASSSSPPSLYLLLLQESPTLYDPSLVRSSSQTRSDRLFATRPQGAPVDTAYPNHDYSSSSHSSCWTRHPN